LARVQPLPLWCFEKEFEKATTKPKSRLATVILLAWTKVTKLTKVTKVKKVKNVKKVTKVTKVKKVTHARISSFQSSSPSAPGGGVKRIENQNHAPGE